MDPDILVSEEDRSSKLIMTRKDVNVINEKSIAEVIEQLYENMKDETENIDMISRKSILELAENNLSVVIRIGIEVLKGFSSPTSSAPVTLEYIQNYTSLIQEIIEKYGSQLDRNTYKITSCFVIDAIQLFTGAQPNPKEIEKFKFFND